MYKLLVVDDDEVICRGIAECIDWAALGINAVNIAYDGELALEAIEADPPDIAIIDMCMPFMDGMELSCRIRERHPDTRIIILSAFRSFEYAKNAIKLNVIEYLTKPFETASLTDAVKRAIAQIEASREYACQTRENAARTRERRLIEWLTADPGAGGVKTIAALLGEGALDKWYQVAVVYIKALADSAFDDDVAVEMATGMARGMFPELIVLSRSNRAVLVLQADAPDGMTARLRDCTARLIRALMAEDRCFLSGALGAPRAGVEQAHRSFAEAQRAVEGCYDAPNGCVVEAGGARAAGAGDAEALVALKGCLADRFSACDLSGALDAVDAFIEALPTDTPPHRLQFVAMEAVISLCRAAGDEALYDRMMTLLMRRFGDLQKALSADEIASWLKEAVSRLFETVDLCRSSYGEKLLDRAMRYIDQCYADPDLSMMRVAEAVSISASYLAFLFRQFGGCSFVAYLTSVRMEKAKKLLLDREVRLYEIADRTGYNSPQYFSATFRKCAGCTPSEFRKRGWNESM
jgi:two-component system response regulator YesN